MVRSQVKVLGIPNREGILQVLVLQAQLVSEMVYNTDVQILMRLTN